MNVYSVVAVPAMRRRFWMPSVESVEQYLESQIAGSTVRRLEQDRSDRFTIDIEINDRDSHETALAELIQVVGQLGLSFAASEVTEYATAEAASAGAGFLLGAGLGASAASAFGALIGGLIGLVAGDIVGSTRLRVVARFSAQRGAHGGWSFQAHRIVPQEALGWTAS